MEISKDSALKPVLNEAEALPRFMNDRAFLVDTLNRFIQSEEDFFKSIHNAVQTEDLPSLQRIFHNLKGLAATVGAERLRDKAAALEKLATPDQIILLKEQLLELKTEFELLTDYCRKFLN